jgi:hypothetical protein
MADILPPAPIDAPFSSYNWADWYKKVRDAINNAATIAWTAITGTPTTLAGYGINDARPIVLVASLASDQATTAAVTPVDLSGLVWSYDTNSTYEFKWVGQVSPAANTTGCGFQLDVSSAVTSITMGFYHQLANTGTLSGGSSVADDTSAGVSSGMPGTGNYPVIGNGLLITGANTGTAQLRFRSEVAAVTTAKAGLTLIVTKIA